MFASLSDLEFEAWGCQYIASLCITICLLTRRDSFFCDRPATNLFHVHLSPSFPAPTLDHLCVNLTYLNLW